MSYGEITTRAPDWRRVETISLIAAATAIIAFVVLAFTPVAGRHPLAQAAISYSVAFHFWLAVPLGSIVVLMIHYLTGGSWGVLLRPFLERSASTLWLMAILFIPIAVSLFFGPSSPYPWARPLDQVVSGDLIEDLRDKTHLLNPPFVLSRAAGYFAVWLLLAHFLRSWSNRWREGDANAGHHLTAISGPGLIVYGITITFAAIDWVMSLEPFWRSTMYPPIYAIGQMITGFAVAVVATVVLSNYPPLAGRVIPKHRRDLGGLLLVFVLLWAYFSFSQFLLIWVGNLTAEAPYYLKRMRGGWEWVGIGLIVLHFAVPFLLLLFRDVKQSQSLLVGVALGVLAMRFVDVLWWIEAAFPHKGEPFFWLMDIAAFVAIGGVWLWWFAGGLRHASLEPVHGPFQCEVEASNA